MRTLNTLAGSLFVLVCMGSGAGAAAEDAEKQTILDATEVMNQIARIPETRIPPSLLRNSQAVAVVPNVIKVGFVVGGRAGKGVILVRQKETGRWGNPAFLNLTGGSVGFQIGAQSSDIILIFKSRRGVEGMIDGKFTLGADAAVAAGPVGRDVAAATDVQLKAEIYSYSRSRGLFAGISVDGSVLDIDSDANGRFYGDPGISSAQVLYGEDLKMSPEISALKVSLDK